MQVMLMYQAEGHGICDYMDLLFLGESEGH